MEYLSRDISIVAYDYNDLLVLPALVETKSLSGVSTEYYVDEAMNIVKVVHVRDSTDLAGFEYERDSKNRITEIREYRGGQLKATTTYAYGDGNLSSSDLDASTHVDPSKLFRGLHPRLFMLVPIAERRCETA